jgi:hypothetical protein
MDEKLKQYGLQALKSGIVYGAGLTLGVMFVGFLFRFPKTIHLNEETADSISEFRLRAQWLRTRAECLTIFGKGQISFIAQISIPRLCLGRALVSLGSVDISKK